MDYDVKALARQLILNSVWAVAPVEEEPELQLARWRVYAVGHGRHFVGYNVTHREGRVSTAITSFDPETRRGVTASGRVYELIGAPGYDSHGDYVFGIWLRRQGLTREDAVVVPVDEFLTPEST
jgi:hypothetical protein